MGIVTRSLASLGLVPEFRTCDELQVTLPAPAAGADDDESGSSHEMLSVVDRRLAAIVGHHCRRQTDCHTPSKPRGMIWQLVRCVRVWFEAVGKV